MHLANEAVKVFTRRGHDWTHRFKKVADDAWHIKASSAIIDGEVVVPAADGSTDFSVLQNELTGTSTKFVLVAFDLLYLAAGTSGRCRYSSKVTWEQRIINGDAKFEAPQRIPKVSYLRFAEMIGLRGIFVDSPQLLGLAWEQALASEPPVVLEVKTDPRGAAAAAAYHVATGRELLVGADDGRSDRDWTIPQVDPARK